MTSPARWLKGPLAAFGLAIAVLGANYLAYPMLEERLVLASQDSSTSTLGLVTDAMDQASERYEPLPRLIASDPILRQLINEPGNQGVVPFVNEKLRQLTDTLEVSDIYVIGPAGRVLAASNYRQTRSLMAVDLSHRPYVARALQGEPAHFHARVGQTRSFTFAAPILDGIEVRGVLAVQVNVEALEASWESGPHDILVADQNGIVFLSSREDYLLRSLAPLSDGVRARIEAARQLPMAELDQIPFAAGLIAESAVEVVLGEGEDAQSFLANSSPLSLTGWHAIVLVPLRPIRQQALYALAVGNLAAAALALIALVIYQRRARVLERMRVQESQQALLEQMVEERTADLDHANATLRGEVSERKAAEERLRRTQKDLVQAGKLAALGQMSAAISHEINQPLAAVKSYADNAAAYLKRDRPEDAAGNIARISQMADRMAKISGHLRNFARRPGDAVSAVPLSEVVEEAIALLEPQLRQAGCALDFAAPNAEVWVQGGRLRLQQVLINLMKNALDAMEGAPEKRIEIAMMPGSEEVRLSVRDCGPGLSDDALEQAFDAFYTTKEAGSGMGLGLSISFNIIEDFGGHLTAANHPEGGGLFAMILRPAEAPGAAPMVAE